MDSRPSRPFQTITGPMDTYSSFKQLKAVETEYHITHLDRGSDITIIAPHGGNIEPHTSEIAALIAADTHNLFCFNGLKQRDNHLLHITSHHYDEEQALSLVRSSTTVISVHGCTRKEAVIFVGGRDDKLKRRISAALNRAHIPAVACNQYSPHRGNHPDNICNRGITGKGVQLEISRPLRDSPQAWSKIAAAVGHALAS